MDFRLGERSDALRAEVRAFLDEAITPELEEHLYRTGTSHDAAFNEALLERGWFAPGWPPEWGGQGRDPIELLVLGEELSRADAPTYANGTTTMVARVILAAGSEEMKREILPKALRGEIVIVLGFSEPESGSDVAAAQCRAVRDGDEWVINGQKMFTTNAHIADYVFLLTRTNPKAAKHKGLTTFLVPMKQPGVEVQAVYTLSGERTNITFYNDVRVPDSARIGDVDAGWRVMTASLQDEHSAGFGGRIARLLEEAEAWAEESGRIEEPDVRERLARCAAEVEVSLLLQRRSAWMAEQGEVPVAEGPMAKLYSSEALERAAEDLCELVGPDALRSYLDPTAPRRGRIEHARRFSLGTTIYAGTSEIQRTIIAQRGLGLPR
jgi:alkylation response protein AidB-like acyl-CoA dehydrogenase